MVQLAKAITDSRGSFPDGDCIANTRAATSDHVAACEPLWP